jgi:hypothetical protein
MRSKSPHNSHHPDDDAEEFEPGSLPVEPDRGPDPGDEPLTPEHDSPVDPVT